MIDLVPLGERAFLARFVAEPEAAAWAEAVRTRGWPGVLDVVPAYTTVAVFADPDRIDLDDLERRLRALIPEDSAPEGSGRLVRLPVLYDGEDLPWVAGQVGASVEEVIALHSGPAYRVFAIGFLPGFPYAGYLPSPLAGLPRRASPRVSVPAGSVAIAGRQTGIYPEPSPGGWHLLGRTPLRIVDVAAGHFPIRAGDRLRFEPIDAHQHARLAGERL